MQFLHCTLEADMPATEVQSGFTALCSNGEGARLRGVLRGRPLARGGEVPAGLEGSNPPFSISSISSKIVRPPYAVSGEVSADLLPAAAVTWSRQEILCICAACQLARKVLEKVKVEVAVGVTTENLDEVVRQLVLLQ